MYGYIVPVQSELADNEYVLFRAFFCGICLDISARFGQFARYATNYDFTFLAILLNDYMTNPVDIVRRPCISSLGRKRVVIASNALLQRINDANILLACAKLRDDIADQKRLSARIALRLLKRAHKVSLAGSADLDAIITSRLDALASHESASSAGLDQVSDCFGAMLSDLAKAICGGVCSPHLSALCYNLGKYVYLIDALDDVDQDMRTGCYNVWLASCQAAESRQQFFERNADQISFVLNSTINRAIESFNALEWTQSYNVLANVIHLGLRRKFAEVLDSPHQVGAAAANAQMRRTKKIPARARKK